MTITKLTKEQWLKVAKAAVYLVVSTLVGAAIAVVQGQPELFGIYTPIVNVVLVTVKQAFTEE